MSGVGLIQWMLHLEWTWADKQEDTFAAMLTTSPYVSTDGSIIPDTQATMPAGKEGQDGMHARCIRMLSTTQCHEPSSKERKASVCIAASLVSHPSLHTLSWQLQPGV